MAVHVPSAEHARAAPEAWPGSLRARGGDWLVMWRSGSTGHA